MTRRRQNKKHHVMVDDGMHTTGLALRESETVRLSLKREKLELEDKHRGSDYAERSKEQTERVAEVASYHEPMDRVMQQNAQQMHAVLSLMTSMIEKQQKPKYFTPLVFVIYITTEV